MRNDFDTFSLIQNDSPVTPCSTKTESCLASQFLSEFRLVDEEVIPGYVITTYAQSPVHLILFHRLYFNGVSID